jgi:hypothetical protein
MANRDSAPVLPEKARFTEGHGEALVAADVVFGGFCFFMTGVALYGWYRGHTSGISALAIFSFVLANLALSQVSLRVKKPYTIEFYRAVMGGVIAPTAHFLVNGELSPWWPGYLIMCLGGSIILGLLTQRPFWGRLLVVYYLALAVMVAVIRGESNWYQVALYGGVIAMMGLMFAQVMSLLGKTLKGLHDGALELRAAHDKLFAEVEVAHEIQTLLLPNSPTLPGTRVTGKMLPADQVGGDYYDVLEIGGRRFLAIGDVSGHGVTSGLTMMMARTGLLGILEANPRAPLGAIYRALNRCLRLNLERMGIEMYMTFALVESLGGGRFEAVGQHLPPVIYRPRDQAVEFIELAGAWLGVLEDLPDDMLPTVSFTLTPGDMLLLYTDGVIERFAGKVMFGFERLKSVVLEHAPKGPEALIEATFEALERFSPGQKDDITVMAVSYVGEAPSMLAEERPASPS